MELTLQIGGLCVVCALLSVVVKRGSPELSMLLVISAAVMICIAIGQTAQEVIPLLAELQSNSGISTQLFLPIYKTIGIALIVRVCGNLCKDAGEAALASAMEAAGALCAVLVSVPLIRAVLSTLLELMK